MNSPYGKSHRRPDGETDLLTLSLRPHLGHGFCVIRRSLSCNRANLVWDMKTAPQRQKFSCSLIPSNFDQSSDTEAHP